MYHQDPPHHQDATQNRNKLLLRKLSQTREREREQEHERLHQLQSINNLLLDMPPSPSYLQDLSSSTQSTPPSSSYLQDLSSSSQSDKNVSIEGEVFISSPHHTHSHINTRGKEKIVFQKARRLL